MGGFGASIKTAKAIMHGGFMGADGINAIDAYVDATGRDVILADMKKRQATKLNNVSF